LKALPQKAQEALTAAHRRQIWATPPLTTWEEVFSTRRVQSFITWHAYRVWPWGDPTLASLPPRRPSTRGRFTAIVIEQLAKRTGRPEHPHLLDLLHHLDVPRAMHAKLTGIHDFSLTELKAIGLALMDEAARIRPEKLGNGWRIRPPLPNKRRPWPHGYPLSRRAVRYQGGLILCLMVALPMRVRNWSECRLGHNLWKDETTGAWHFLFEGPELKIGKRKTDRDDNRYDPILPQELAPALETFLAEHRPHLPTADTAPYLFLSRTGKRWDEKNIRDMLRDHVYRHSGKRFYPHLIRSLYVTEHLDAGVSLNTVAYALNDQPGTVLATYNRLRPPAYQATLSELYTQLGKRSIKA
jgi:Phage integrase family